MTPRPARWAVPVVLACALVPSGMARAQDGPAEVDRCERAGPGHVVVYGDVPRPFSIPVSGLESLPRVTVRGELHDGRTATFEGVRIRELLTRAGVPVQLSSAEIVRYVVVEATDGYRALFSLAELEPDFHPEAPILADMEDGAPLDPKYGPVQVIVPGELSHMRWVRQVECLRVGAAARAGEGASDR